MMMNISMLVRLASAGAMMIVGATAAQSAELISNGDFETGTFAGWNANVQGGSSGNLYLHGNGAAAPQTGFSVPLNAGGGNFDALTDQGGGGSYSLTQAFTLAAAGTVHISFDILTANDNGVAYPNGRNYGTNPNQNATVDILGGGANAFTNAPGDIMSVLYAQGSDNLGWHTVTGDIALGAGSYLFRFAETDNQFFFRAGLDNVSITTGSVPEPASWAMMLGGFGLIGGALRRRRAMVSFA